MRASTEITRARKERVMRLRAIRDAHAANGDRCCYCGVVPSWRGRCADYPSLDHVLPQTRGGGDAAENLAYCCRGCNSTKCNFTVEEAHLKLRLRRLGWPYFNETQIAWLRGQGFDFTALDTMKLYFEEREASP